ncbi:penicillin-binding protein 1A [Andreprevotia lacus DSM 23236]|jgi:penicillin-binding protein 1A|uniref:Penicillin-binding protein 1A n=1 Tax=Andreprevotia lacus DSM 23236 TaxID=1121001 RepID=A0A1W1Y2D4_9NEIS|nr:penicillin-binding protein 1A [Andreprevotia lacus]SMC29898.1 penicillin-binding protein 1A [Andreprevotia lacus DSM 23236]
MTKRILLIAAGTLAGVLLLLGGLILFAVLINYPRLPSLEALTDYRPKMPLRVYTSDAVLIGEFGEERRAFIPIDQVPAAMKQALLAAEDERFYQHGGIDYLGVLRAMAGNVLSGHSQSGASTITMQVARNFYLSNEKTFTRKFNEALLSFKIEHNLSKDQILELYINQIYLGQRAYGFSSAAQTYFGKELKDLTIAEYAMLAGLPKAPSAYNPIVNPKRAGLRQQYVLRRMHELHFIDDAQYEAALKEPLHLKRYHQEYAVHGEYVAEMVRQMMTERYKEATYTQGFKVYTTLSSQQQEDAYQALRQGLLDYDQRHGYRGPESFIDEAQLAGGKDEGLDDALAEIKDADDLVPAVVLSANANRIQVYIKGGERQDIGADGLKFARSALSDKNPPASRIRPGAIIRVKQNDKGWVVSQLPQVEGAFVAIDPQNGALRALVGGFDFNRNNFNHVTQAWRQPGSSFKPFIYSASLERGVTPATLINDAPLVIDPGQVGGQKWEPKNFDGKYAGMISVRNALTLSKNLVSIRILQAIGTDYAQQHITRFGFSPKQHPAYLTMALGAGSVTPLQMSEAYSVFANTGYRVHSYFVDRIEDARGKVLAKTAPEVAGQSAKRTLDARNAFVMTSIMQDVVRFGTAARANRALGRPDLAGKTGTTNDANDAWFAGFQPSLVAIAWVGFDQPRSLGGRETGGAAALPIWISFMSKALKNVPVYQYPVPEGVTPQTIEGEKGTFTEYFFNEFTQTNPELGLGSGGGGASQPLDEIKDQLF